MRKREIQSIPLKLSELKEYDAIKEERAAAAAALSGDKSSMQIGESSTTKAPLAKVGPKNKQEIFERIGLKTSNE